MELKDSCVGCCSVFVERCRAEQIMMVMIRQSLLLATLITASASQSTHSYQDQVTFIFRYLRETGGGLETNNFQSTYPLKSHDTVHFILENGENVNIRNDSLGKLMIFGNCMATDVRVNNA